MTQTEINKMQTRCIFHRFIRASEMPVMHSNYREDLSGRKASSELSGDSAERTAKPKIELINWL